MIRGETFNVQRPTSNVQLRKGKAPAAVRVARWFCMSAIVVALGHEYFALLRTEEREDTRYKIEFIREWARQHPSAGTEKPSVEIVPNDKLHGNKL